MELRETLRTLRGGSGSVVLTGIGGVGKSSVAGRVMARLAEQGWVCSATTGTWSLKALCDALQVDLLTARQQWARELRDQLGALPADDDVRLPFLGRVLRQHPVLLVLDNFEDHLKPDGTAFTDTGTSSVIKHLIESCGAGRLLVTCRYPLPGMQNLLRHLTIGPLSPSETRRLVLRLAGLRTLTSEDATLVHRLVGGHPRVLEFLDALRRRGASIDRVRQKFTALARDHGIDVNRTRAFGADVTVAVQLGARDICLEMLLTALNDTERTVLLQTAVSSLPVPAPDLTVALAGSGLDGAALTRAAQRLADLSLVLHTDEGLWVHRWTAEGLRERQSPEDYRDRCRRAGELRQQRIASAPRDVEEGIEATQNFLDAQEWDDATEIATGVADFLAQDSNLQRLSFAAQVLAALPSQARDYFLFVDHEGAALVALGFTSEAVERYRHLVDAFTQRADAEPGRADYQRDLSVSYQRLGMCFVQLERFEEAAAALEQYLQLALDAYQRLPGQVDVVVDLAFALHLTSELYEDGDERSRHAWELLEVLEAIQRLPSHGKALLDSLRGDQDSPHRRTT